MMLNIEGALKQDRLWENEENQQQSASEMKVYFIVLR